MRLYAEVGVGNATILSTEIEWSDGSEMRLPGFIVGRKPTPYLRLWIGRRVLVLDRDGLSWRTKPRFAFKVLLGLASSPV